MTTLPNRSAINPAEEAWAEAYALKARIEARETLRKARHAWSNPAGRESIALTVAEKASLLAVVAAMVAFVWWAL